MKEVKILVRDFDPEIDLPILELSVKKFALIGSFDNYNNAKVHISKDNLTIDAYCGRMGIQYCFVSNTGFQYDETKLFSINEIIDLEKICKKCLNSLKKNKITFPSPLSRIL